MRRAAMVACLLILGTAVAEAQSRRGARRGQADPDLPRIGIQVGLDRWKADPIDAPVSGGPGLGLRYETNAFGGDALRSFYVVDLYSLKKTSSSGGRAVTGDVAVGLTLAPRLNNGLTPYAGGGFGLTWGGAVTGLTPVVSFGAQLARQGKMPYVDVTWYTKSNRRIAFSVGFFL